MRTTRSTVEFRHSFVLNRDVEELPAGTYEIEIDEDEILLAERSAYRRTAINFFVEREGSTRTLAIDPADLESALGRDSETRAGPARSEPSL